MNLDSPTLQIGTVVACIAGSFAVTKWRQDRGEKDVDAVWGVIKTMRNEITGIMSELNKHIRDSDKARLDIEKDFGHIRISLSETNGKFGAIMEKLEGISDELRELKESRS
jgi:hypothetical protein